MPKPRKTVKRPTPKYSKSRTSKEARPSVGEPRSGKEIGAPPRAGVKFCALVITTGRRASLLQTLRGLGGRYPVVVSQGETSPAHSLMQGFEHVLQTDAEAVLVFADDVIVAEGFWDAVEALYQPGEVLALASMGEGNPGVVYDLRPWDIEGQWLGFEIVPRSVLEFLDEKWVKPLPQTITATADLIRAGIKGTGAPVRGVFPALCDHALVESTVGNKGARQAPTFRERKAVP